METAELRSYRDIIADVLAAKPRSLTYLANQAPPGCRADLVRELDAMRLEGRVEEYIPEGKGFRPITYRLIFP